jgi:hypothetical protein
MNQSGKNSLMFETIPKKSQVKTNMLRSFEGDLFGLLSNFLVPGMKDMWMSATDVEYGYFKFVQ